jgi:hypothetical protein
MYQRHQSDGFPGMESMKNDTSRKCALEGMPMMRTKMSPVLQLATPSSPVTQILLLSYPVQLASMHSSTI